MKTFTTIAALAALSSTTLSATVTIKETACLQESELEEYTIEIGKLVVQNMPSVCGLEIVSASDDIDVKAITCQAFKDAEGTEPGSAPFTQESPALIATNPVQEASILCEVKTEATVTIRETACLQESELEEYTIEIGKLVVQDMPNVCGLEIVASTNADMSAITCQAFKDAEGKEPGSAPFTVESPALISTNPVQEAAIRCNVDGDNQATPTGFETVYPTTGGVAAPTGTGGLTPGGNGTVTMTGAPSQPTETGFTPPGDSAAGRVEWSGAVSGLLAVGAAILGMGL